jgi:hypothetical protein
VLYEFAKLLGRSLGQDSVIITKATFFFLTETGFYATMTALND